MNFSIKQTILLENLNYVIKGISTKNLIPILNCIKFELTKDGLYLISTDNEMAIKTFISKDKIETIDSLGETVVSGKYIYDIVKKLPGEIINIEEVANSKIFITTKNSKFNLNCNNVNDFPDLELSEVEKPILMKKSLFKQLINQTSFATSTQESRPTLTGINFLINNSECCVIATDSYRLSKKQVEINNEGQYNLIIPNRTILELCKIINDKEEDLEIHIFSNKVIFKFDSIIFLTRLINGSFPDTASLIPNEFFSTIKVSYVDFFNAIDRASLLSSGDDKNTITLEMKDNIILISSTIPEIGTVEEKIEMKEKSGEEIKIAFSSKFMTDALRAIDANDIILNFNGEIKPIIIKNENDVNLIELIVPIRTY